MEEYVQYCNGCALIVSHAVLRIPMEEYVQYCTSGAIVVSHAVLIILHGRICTVLHWWCYSGKSCCINNPPWKNMYSIELVVL